MRLQQSCMICDAALSKEYCRACGRGVCSAHYNQEKQLCTDCVGVA